MKNTFIIIAILLCTGVQAQVRVAESSTDNALNIVQVLTNLNGEDETKCVTRILANETSIQRHNGEEVYKTIREVEYIIKETSKKITTKRNILRTKTEKLSEADNVEAVFPDMTYSLLSAVFSPTTIKKGKEHQALPCTVERNKNAGTTFIEVDKLGILKSQGKDVSTNAMGATVQFKACTETLCYKSLVDELFINSLHEVNNEVEILIKEKSGKENKVEVEEHIVITSLLK